ncbi:acyltransferase [Filimonas effusa]|uniref:Acyltransferase n=1 Tax=Filimonas effusa TaxID=2508721 RepID=A0A4Q1D1Y7_9BACT|nr:acyltransferase [Filimonas effusa]RXK81794.1 acyltransferase [Filimonas effusa]
MSVTTFIKTNPRVKKLVHRLLIPKGGARPRLWVRMFLNPFIHKKGKGATIRWRTRIDVVPFNAFTMGTKAVIEDFCTINNGVGAVSIGNHSLVGMSNVIIGPVSIGNNVIMAQNIVASGLNHTYTDVTLPIQAQNVTTAPIVIEDDCWIAANVVITAGVTIGKHSVIAGGSVVTKDIPPFSVAAGNPAKVIKQYNPQSGEWERTKA